MVRKGHQQESKNGYPHKGDKRHIAYCSNLEQADIYFKYKGKKPLTEAEKILFTTAIDYLKGVMNGKTTIPTKIWKEEYTKLTAERKTLNQRYLALKESERSRENQKERLQYLVAGTVTPQKAGNGAITHRAAG